MVKTVKGSAEGFTDHQVAAARRAHLAYDIVGCPSPRDFECMVRANMIRNFPVTVTDTKNCHSIFGNDVGSIRLNTVRTKKDPIVSNYIAIMPIVMEQNSKLDLTGNIFC